MEVDRDWVGKQISLVFRDIVLIAFCFQFLSRTRRMPPSGTSRLNESPGMVTFPSSAHSGKWRASTRQLGCARGLTCHARAVGTKPPICSTAYRFCMLPISVTKYGHRRQLQILHCRSSVTVTPAKLSRSPVVGKPKSEGEPLRQIEPYKSNKEAGDEVVENTQESRSENQLRFSRSSRSKTTR
jgi:hypothetical protein